MKLNKTYKRNKNNKKLNIKGGKTKKGKTKKGKTSNKTTGGADMPKVVVKSRFIKKNPVVVDDVNRFDINITSHYDQDYFLYEAEDFFTSF